MENLSLYQITSSFPKLIEEEMSEEDKKEVKKELTELLQQKKPKFDWIYKKYRINYWSNEKWRKEVSEQRKILESRLTKFKEYG